MLRIGLVVPDRNIVTGNAFSIENTTMEVKRTSFFSGS